MEANLENMIKETRNMKKCKSLLKKIRSYEDWLEYIKLRPEIMDSVCNISGSPEKWYQDMIDDINNIYEREKTWQIEKLKKKLLKNKDI